MRKITLFTLLSLLLMFGLVSAQQSAPKCDNNGPHGQRAQFTDCDNHGPHGQKAGFHGDKQFGKAKGEFHKAHGMRGKGRRGQQGDGLQRIIKKAEWLELTDKQVADLKEMSFDFKMEKIDLGADLKKAQVKLKALHSDDASEREIFKAIDDISALKAQMQKMRYSHKNAIKDVLTEDQLDKLKSARNRKVIIEKEIYIDDDGEEQEKEIIKRRGNGRR